MRAVAVILSLSLLAACFPNNERHRTIAKITEGGLVAGGIAILAVANTGADCDMASRPGENPDCKSDAGLVGGIGLAMIIVGLVGFIATVSTAPDDDKPPTPPPPPPPPTTTPGAPPSSAPAP
jgi:hypothetical protein